MLRYITFSIYALSASIAVAQGPDFHPLVTPLRELRIGGRGEAAIRFDPASFRILRLTESELSAEQGRRLVVKGTSLPSLKINRTGLWLVHRVSRDTMIEQPMSREGMGDDSRTWKRKTWTTIGTYERSAWAHFVEFALENGLCGIAESRYQGVSWFTFSFAPISPENLDAGGHRISLNADFRAQMRLSPEYPAKIGNKGFVILLHDPHQNAAGRFQTLSGLRSLISANSSIKFRFLVEGAYEDPSRNIGLAGLDADIKVAAETRAAVVYSLLSRFMINTPLAYRLLYDQQMGAYAIDDNNLLKYNAPPPERSRFEQLTTLENIKAVVRGPNIPLSAEQKEQLLGIVSYAIIYAMADLRDVPDEQVIRYYKDLGELYRRIASVGGDLAKGGVPLNSVDLEALASDAASCKAQQDIYQKALGRNKTMAPEIIRQSLSTSPELPIAFIGSYHTSGITAALQAAGIGYVVIEPRPRAQATKAETLAFDRAIHPDLRDQYLSTVSLNMGFTNPTGSEVKQFYTPKIGSKIPEIRADRLAIEHEFSTIQGSVVDTARLTSVMNNNGSLASVLISSGGSKPPPPGNFGPAFAYFEPGGDQGGKPQLILADVRDSRWKEWDRYNFLRNELFKSPEELAGVTSGVISTFYQDTGSTRLFFTSYDPKSKRTYCFEGKTREAAAFVSMPNGSKTGDQDMRMQVVEMIRTGRQKNG